MNIEKTMENLKKHNMDCIVFNRKEDLLPYLDKMIQDQNIVSVGGSMTLFECGVIDYLRKRDIHFLDRYEEGLTKDDIMEIFRKAFFADVYLTSSNAITEDGYLYNVDGTGNRTAAMIFGPKRVIVVAGINKIVKDVKEAIKRVEEVAAPKNAMRLNQNTPCTKTGACENCESKTKICRDYVLIKNPLPNRISVVLVNESLGY